MDAQPVVVDGEWVAQRLEDPDVRILDVRVPQFYNQSHLPGAANLAAFFLTTPSGGPPPAANLAQRLGALGVSPSSHIVIYDDGTLVLASRLYWLLQYFGHDSASVLDGGITRWMQEGRSVTMEQSGFAPVPYQFGDGDPTVALDLADFRERLGATDVFVVDARSPAEYLGLQMTAARDGHVPGAVNVEFTDNLRADGGVVSLQDAETLRTMYESIGATPDKQITVYCGSGQRAAVSFLTLKHLGYPRVAMYTPGWTEWGNRDDTPVETNE